MKRIGILYNILFRGIAGLTVIVLLSSAYHHTIIHRKPVIQYTTTKSVDVTIYLVYSENDQPAYYSARLQSPVCMEDLCNPIDIQIEWDLLGDFKAYIENPDDPITKFDHEPLTPADHEKLKKILADKESLLQDYNMEDLVDTNELIYSEEIDGMTGATSKTFEKDIVPGAVYTCYTLWHFVNGDLHSRIMDYTESILDDDLLIEMIHSGKKNYLNHILDDYPVKFSPEINQAIGELIWDSDPIVGVKAISAVNNKYWVSDSIRNLFEENFLQLSNPVRNALLWYFKNDRIPEGYLPILIQLLPDLREYQRSAIYEILKANAGKLDEEMKKLLISLFKSSRYPVLAKEYELMSRLEIEY